MWQSTISNRVRLYLRKHHFYRTTVYLLFFFTYIHVCDGGDTVQVMIWLSKITIWRYFMWQKFLKTATSIFTVGLCQAACMLAALAAISDCVYDTAGWLAGICWFVQGWALMPRSIQSMGLALSCFPWAMLPTWQDAPVSHWTHCFNCDNKVGLFLEFEILSPVWTRIGIVVYFEWFTLSEQFKPKNWGWNLSSGDKTCSSYSWVTGGMFV